MKRFSVKDSIKPDQQLLSLIEIIVTKGHPNEHGVLLQHINETIQDMKGQDINIIFA